MNPSAHRKRLVFGPALADFIPYRRLIDPAVVITRDGDLIGSWRIGGIDCATRSKADVDALHEDLCRMVQSIARERTGLWIHRIRRRVDCDTGQPSVDEAPAAALIHEVHRQTLAARGLFVTEIYLSAVYRPDRSGALKDAHGKLAMELAHFKDTARFIERVLERYRPFALGVVEHNGRRYSEQLRLYGYLLNGIDEAVPYPYRAVGPALATSCLSFNERHISIQGASQKRCALILDLKEYPPATRPGMLEDVLGGPHEVIETQSFLPMNRRDAEAYLTRQRNQLISTNDASATQIEEMLHAMNGVASTDFVMGEYHYTAAVLGQGDEEVQAALATLRGRMNDAGFQSAVIDLIADLAWLSQLPGNFSFRARVARLSSRNFCALAPLHGQLTGKVHGNPWGQAVALFEGLNRAPVYFNFHATPEGQDALGDMAPGNTLIIGPTGSGKTVLELFLLTEAMKFRPRLMLFDKDRSSEVALRALGVQYRVLEHGVFTGINPLTWPDSEKNVAFLQNWVLSLCRPEVRLLPNALSAIEEALRVVCSFPPAYRTLSILCQNIPIAETFLRADLARWCKGGALGWAFDLGDDLLPLFAGRKDMPEQVGFDLTAFYDHHELLLPVMLALLATLDEWIDGRPFIYVISECWKALDDPLFASFIRDKQKTIRKQNGIGILDTQSASDLLDSSHAAALIEQTATMILLPNPKASEKDYCGGLKCTPGEFETLKSFTANDRRFLIKQGNDCLIASLDFSGKTEVLSILSSNAHSVRVLEALRAKTGERFTDWWPGFLAELAKRASPRSKTPKGSGARRGSKSAKASVPETAPETAPGSAPGTGPRPAPKSLPGGMP